jgi:hypothetical protein
MAFQMEETLLALRKSEASLIRVELIWFHGRDYPFPHYPDH